MLNTVSAHVELISLAAHCDDGLPVEVVDVLGSQQGGVRQGLLGQLFAGKQLANSVLIILSSMPDR